jgi:hypothetical protein
MVPSLTAGRKKPSVFAKATKEYAWAYWLMYFCNSLVPLVLFVKKARTNTTVLRAIPSARVRTATTVNPRVLASILNA